MSDQERSDRVARNEASFRAINETLEAGLQRVAREPDEPAGLVCECGHPECVQLVYVDLEKYEEVRGDSRRFLIVPGHDIPEVEDVIERAERYAIVQKHENVRAIVEQTDPRRSR